eukprot:8151677-Pyramimonas_sp.AAC.1
MPVSSSPVPGAAESAHSMPPPAALHPISPAPRGIILDEGSAAAVVDHGRALGLPASESVPRFPANDRAGDAPARGRATAEAIERGAGNLRSP